MGALIISFSSVLVNMSNVHSSVSAFYRVFFGSLFLILGIDIDHLSRSYNIGVVLGLMTAVFYSMFLLILRTLQSDKNDFPLV